MVPMPIRCRRAIAASGTRAMPSAPITTRRYSGYALRLDAAVDDEVEREAPVVRRQVGVRVRAPDLAQQRVGREAAAQRTGDEVLDQHVERGDERDARLERARGGSLARGGGLDQLQRLRRHHGDPRHGTRTVAAAARALQQPGHALGAADLQHLLDRREVDAEVEARRADHGAQPPAAQRVLDPVADVALERAVVQRDGAGPVGPRREQRLVPDLGLRADVGEHQRRRRALDRAHDFRQQLEADVTGPGKALDRRRAQRCRSTIALASWPRITTASAAPAGAGEAGQRSVEVGERRRQSPGRQPGAKRAQARECQLDLHAALGRQELVPLVDDDAGEPGAALPPVGARQQQREALGGRHQHARQPPVLPCPRAGRRVAGAHLDAPVRVERGGGACECVTGVGRQRPQRRDPQQSERRREHLAARGAQYQRGNCDRQRLAHAGRRVQEARAAVRECRPGGFLEVERHVALAREPRPGAGEADIGALARRARRGAAGGGHPGRRGHGSDAHRGSVGGDDRDAHARGRRLRPRRAEPGEEFRFLRLGRVEVARLDVAVAADVLRDAGELDGERVVVRREAGQDLVEQRLVLGDERALALALRGAAEDVEQRAAVAAASCASTPKAFIIHGP